MQNSLKILKRFLLGFAVMIMLNSNSYAIPVPVIAPDQLITQIQQTSSAVTDTQASISTVTSMQDMNSVMGQGMTSVGDMQGDAEKAQKAKKKAERKKKRAEKLKKMKEKAKKAKEKAKKAKKEAKKAKDAYDSGKKAYETGDISQVNLPKQDNVDDEEGTKRKIFSNQADRKLYKAEKKNLKAEKKLNKAEANAYEAKENWGDNQRKADRKLRRAERQHEKAKKKNEKAKKKLNQANDELGFNSYRINTMEEISFAFEEGDEVDLKGCAVPQILFDLGLTEEELEADDEIASFMSKEFVDKKKKASNEEISVIISKYKTALQIESACAFGVAAKYNNEAYAYKERIEDFESANSEGTVSNIMSKLNLVDKEILDAFARLVEIESSNLSLNSLETLGVL